MEEPTPDYTAMTPSDLLATLGDDAGKWAVAFKQHAERTGHGGMDEAWLIGWFANAIEHSSDVRRWRREAEIERLRKAAVAVGIPLVPMLLSGFARLHREGVLSEGQCVRALGMERIAFRALVDSLEQEERHEHG